MNYYHIKESSAYFSLQISQKIFEHYDQFMIARTCPAILSLAPDDIRAYSGEVLILP